MDVCQQYDRIATRYDESRSKALMERAYLERIAREIPDDGAVLDVGCGSGEPIARYFIEHGHSVTGIDGAPAMVALCRHRFPDMTWLLGDMRTMNLGRRFSALLAWDSFFHLTAADQRTMFPIFADHLADDGLLLFTSGHEAGELTNSMLDEAIYHASLSQDEYRQLLSDSSFEVVTFRARDPQCGEHTVWLAKRSERRSL